MTDQELIEKVFAEIAQARKDAGFDPCSMCVSIVASGAKVTRDYSPTMHVSLYTTVHGVSYDVIGAATNGDALRRFRDDCLDRMKREWGCAGVDLLAMGM